MPHFNWGGDDTGSDFHLISPKLHLSIPSRKVPINRTASLHPLWFAGGFSKCLVIYVTSSRQLISSCINSRMGLNTLTHKRTRWRPDYLYIPINVVFEVKPSHCIPIPRSTACGHFVLYKGRRDNIVPHVHSAHSPEKCLAGIKSSPFWRKQIIKSHKK